MDNSAWYRYPSCKKIEDSKNITMRFSRRNLLLSSLAGTVTSALPFTSQGAEFTLDWLALDEGVALVQGAGSNVLVNWGRDGVAMIDGGHEDFSSALLAIVYEHTGAIPSLLFNTHCHRNQIGCNAALGVNGVKIISHENTKLWLGTEIISRWEDQVYPPLANSALPTQTFYADSQQLQFNQQIEYGVLPQAHTDGDIYVFFPQKNILFAGDVVSTDRYPILDYSTNGWIGGMINGLDVLLDLVDDETRIFGSTGAETNRAALEEQRAMLSAMIEKIGANYYSGGTFQEFVNAEPSAEFDERWGDPRLFLLTAYQGVWGHTGEVRRFSR